MRTEPSARAFEYGGKPDRAEPKATESSRTGAWRLQFRDLVEPPVASWPPRQQLSVRESVLFLFLSTFEWTPLTKIHKASVQIPFNGGKRKNPVKPCVQSNIDLDIETVFEVSFGVR